MKLRSERQTSTHERLTEESSVKASSNRTLGVVFSLVFLIIGIWPWLFGQSVRSWAVIVAAIFVSLALFKPTLLTPLNRMWTKLGLLLHKVTNPIILGLIFFAIMTPAAIVMRFMGRDHLRLRFDSDAESYWIDRAPPGPAPDSIRNQF